LYLLRALELTSLSVFGVAYVLAETVTATPEPLLKFGPLGLVAFMIVQNYRQSKDLTRANERLSASLSRIAEALEDRPCLHGDSRLRVREKENQAHGR
jgi:hypothetical protein